jgi:hypothetical protein
LVCAVKDGGHGEWLAGDTEELPDAGGSVHSYFADQRSRGVARAQLVVCDAGSSFDTIGSSPAGYAAPLFGSLQYDDVRHAHSETFIPVDTSDFVRADTSETLEQRTHQRAQAPRIASTAEATAQLAGEAQKDEASGLHRQYALAKELADSRDAQRQVRGTILALGQGRA